MEMARRNNCNVLRGRLDFNCLDDSFDDPDYCVKKNEDTSKDSDDIYSFGEEEFFNPFEENDSNNSFVNPFEENLSNGPRETAIKMAEDFNPFATSSPTSDIKNEKALKKENICPHCEIKYSSNYNLKQHIISVHKIFPPGITIFKCSKGSCDFVTGNRVQFSRHTHARQTQPSTVKTFCQVCGVQFFNPSSLKRHIGRVHKQ